MATPIEMCNCGKMLNKFRNLNRKFKINEQFQSKRYIRRILANTSEDNCESRDRYSNRTQCKVVNVSEKVTEKHIVDFFGIESVSDVTEIKKTSTVSPVQKFDYLFNKKPSPDEEPIVEEKVLVTTFGSVRLDAANQVKTHGQHDKVFLEKMSMLQPEKYLIGKHQKIGREYRNLFKSSSSQHPNELIDTNKSESIKFNDDQTLSSAIDQTELMNQKDKNNFATTNVENKVQNAKYNKDCKTIDQNINIHPVTELDDESNYIDEQYFNKPETTNNEQNMENDSKHHNIDIYPDTANGQNSNFYIVPSDCKNNYIDEQYFNQLEKKKTGILNQNNANESCNFIEDHYFEKNEHNLHSEPNIGINDCSYSTIINSSGPLSHPQVITKLQSTEESCASNTNTPQSKLLGEKAYEDTRNINHKQKHATSQPTGKSTKHYAINTCLNEHACNLIKESEKVLNFEETINEHHGFNTAKVKKQYVKPNIENPQTAYDYVMKLRKEETQKNQENSSITTGRKSSLGNEKLDSKGFLILKTQVQDFRYLNQDAIITTLKNSILYNDNDIIAFSKPYGLVCKGGNKKLNGIDIQTCLPDLAKRIFKKSVDSKLYLVHSTDKETTGVLVLARTEMMAHLLSDLFSKNQIKKIYWTLTRGIPDIPEGVIDIPIAEGTIDHKRRMVLRPDDDEVKFLAKPSKQAERAITHYNIISTQGNASLIEVKPETSIKHQIRVHLGFGLRCPILGDHKYSHLNKIAPQTLPDDMLRRLCIRQSKVRYVPMHLHLKTLVIPEILEGKNLFIHASLPYHFRTNLHKLKFRKA